MGARSAEDRLLSWTLMFGVLRKKAVYLPFKIQTPESVLGEVSYKNEVSYKFLKSPETCPPGKLWVRSRHPTPPPPLTASWLPGKASAKLGFQRPRGVSLPWWWGGGLLCVTTHCNDALDIFTQACGEQTN